MNNYIYVGKIINTFGIKGEVKIDSDFEYKDRIFNNNFSLYIGPEKIKEVIDNHRIHKGYDMVLFKNYSNINEVLKYKGLNIYIERSDLKLKEDEYLLIDLIGFKVYDKDDYLGDVIDYEVNNMYVLLKVHGNKTFYIPNIEKYINKIDKSNKVIITNNGSDLII